MPKNKKVKRLFTGSLIVFAAITACCAKQHPRQAYEAVASLRKVQAATQVGVSYQQYGQFLIEAKDKTNAALRVLSDGPVKTEIQATMDAYADAGQAWGQKLESGRDIVDLSLIVCSKYSLKCSSSGSVYAEPAMQTIWLNADLHLNKLAELLPENSN